MTTLSSVAMFFAPTSVVRKRGLLECAPLSELISQDFAQFVC